MTGVKEALTLRLYRHALKLYPAAFRDAYACQAFLTAREWYEASIRERHLVRFCFGIVLDLALSIARERATDLGRQVMKRPIQFYTAGLAVIATAVGLTGALVGQQMLRRGADEPQRQMVNSFAVKIAKGAVPEEAIAANQVDMAEDLEPFLTFYDEGGTPISSTGYLNGVIPVPPAGIFAHLRTYGSHTVTWQPRHGVRIAVVARKIEGAHSGFVLAGRSLRIVEEYEATLRSLALTGWLLTVAALVGGAVFLDRATPPAAPAANATV